MRVKMSKQTPPAPTASAVGPCPTVIQIVGRPGTGSLPSTIAPPDHPQYILGGGGVNLVQLHPNLPLPLHLFETVCPMMVSLTINEPTHRKQNKSWIKSMGNQQKHRVMSPGDLLGVKQLH